MRFLLTNDDGVDAPGLAALRCALAWPGGAVVVAPDRHWSGCGHQVTTTRPLHLQSLADDRFALDGSPADCVRVGLLHVAPGAEWVIAGINEGGNVGSDVHVSGTVAAAREACLLGKPAIAISQYIRRRPIDWQRAARWAGVVCNQLIARPLPAGCFWNVNLPHAAGDDPAIPELVDCEVDPSPLPVDFELIEGKLHYRGSYHDRPRRAKHDVDICFSGAISISQVRIA